MHTINWNYAKRGVLHMITSIACWTVVHCQKSYSENTRDALKYRHTLLVSLLCLMFWSLAVITPVMPLKRPLSLNWAFVWDSVFWDKGGPLAVKTNKTCGLTMCVHILTQGLDFSSATGAFHFEMFSVSFFCSAVAHFSPSFTRQTLKGLAVYYMMHHSWVIILYYIVSCGVGKISGYIV